MKVRKTLLPDCYEVIPEVIADQRGRFVKVFQNKIFIAHQLSTNFVEEYYTYSRYRVLRGLHFQVPPHEHTKLVYCVLGNVMDAIVDLRLGSPTFGQHIIVELSADRANVLYIPPGMAHGFYVLTAEAILVYNVTSVHSPDHDTGIHWNSIGIPWPDAQPIVSLRDGNLAHFPEFRSPFRYQG